MKRISKQVLWTFLVTMGLALPTLSAQTATVDTDLQARAARIEKVFAQIQVDDTLGRDRPKIYEMNEADMNAFLELEVRKVPETGLRGFSVKMKSDNTFSAHLTVDPEEIQIAQESMLGGLLSSLLSGDQILIVEGVLRTEAGSGTYEVTSASLNDIPVPATVVEGALRAVGSRLDPPFDPTEGFTLQFGIRKIEVRPGVTLLHTGAVR